MADLKHQRIWWDNIDNVWSYAMAITDFQAFGGLCCFKNVFAALEFVCWGMSLMNSTLVRMALRLILDLCILGKFWMELSSEQMTSLKIFCGFSWSSARQQCRVGPFGHCNAACGTNIWDKEPNLWHAWKALGCDMLWLFDWRVSAFRSKGQHCSARSWLSEWELEDDFEDLELIWVFQLQKPVNLKKIRMDHTPWTGLEQSCLEIS